MNLSWSPPDVILTFDDAVSNHATFVAPLLGSLGFGATFYIAEYPGQGTDQFAIDKNQYMTWEQIAGLHASGFEVGNHTGRHILMDQAGREEIQEEIQVIEQRCTTHGIPRPITFAYPCGHESEIAHSVLAEAGYLLARGCGNRPYRRNIDSPLSIPSYVITGETEALFYKTLTDRREDECLVYTFHGIPDHNHPWVNTPPDTFKKMMHHLHSLGIQAGSMRSILPPG